MNRKWGHDDLAHDLAQHLRVNPEHIVWENMQMGPSGSIRPDVYLLKKSYSTFAPVTYETKVSVSDFRSDITSGKWQGYLKFSSAVIFAVPAGLISKDDVPAGCGLIVRHDEIWRTVKRPTMQKIDTLSHREWMKLVIDGVERAVLQRDTARVRCGLNSYTVEAALRSKVGADIAKMISMAMRSKESLEYAIGELKKQEQEVREETQFQLKYALDKARRSGQELSSEQARLAAALGLGADATADQLISAMGDAARRLSGDAEVTRLRRLFENIKRYTDEGSEPLPCLQEVQFA